MSMITRVKDHFKPIRRISPATQRPKAIKSPARKTRHVRDGWANWTDQTRYTVVAPGPCPTAYDREPTAHEAVEAQGYAHGFIGRDASPPSDMPADLAAAWSLGYGIGHVRRQMDRAKPVRTIGHGDADVLGC
jgi:hypothetical protein